MKINHQYKPNSGIEFDKEILPLVESRLLTQGSFGKLTMEKTLNTEIKIMSECLRNSTLLLQRQDMKIPRERGMRFKYNLLYYKNFLVKLEIQN